MKIDLVAALYMLQNINIQTLVYTLAAETVNKRKSKFRNLPIMFHILKWTSENNPKSLLAAS